MSRLLCLRPSDAVPVTNVETVWELDSNFFLVSKKQPHRFHLGKAKKRIFLIECFVCILCLILVIESWGKKIFFAILSVYLWPVD